MAFDKTWTSRIIIEIIFQKWFPISSLINVSLYNYFKTITAETLFFIIYQNMHFLLLKITTIQYGKRNTREYNGYL